MRQGLTKAMILGTPLPEAGKEVWLHDGLVSGLAVRIRAGAPPVFYFYRRADGKPGRLSLGTLAHLGSVEAAREVARGHNRTIAAGGNPFTDRAEKRAKAAKIMPTLENLWEDFRLHHVEARYKPSTVALCNALWKHLEPWAGRRLAEITRGDVEALKNKLATSIGGVTANRVVGMLRTMFAKRGQYFDLPEGFNPAAKVEKLPEQARERVLSPEELTAFNAALEAHPDPIIRAVFRMALYTGARKSNVLGMRWEDVSLTRGEWGIPGAVTKNGRPLKIPLVPEAVAVLQSLPDDSPYVFPRRVASPEQVARVRELLAGGKSTYAAADEVGLSQSTIMRIVQHPDFVGGESQPLQNVRGSFASICKAAGIKGATLHDLRRTFITFMIRGGASLPVTAAAAGHRSMATTQKHYAQVMGDTVRAGVTAGIAAMAGKSEPVKIKGKAG